MREFADGDVVDAGLADDSGRLDRQAAARFDHDARLHLVAHRHGFAHLVGREVVDQDLIGAGLDRGAQPVDRIDLDLDRDRCRPSPRTSANASATPPAAATWLSFTSAMS